MKLRDRIVYGGQLAMNKAFVALGNNYPEMYNEFWKAYGKNISIDDLQNNIAIIEIIERDVVDDMPAAYVLRDPDLIFVRNAVAHCAKCLIVTARIYTFMAKERLLNS